MARSGARLDGLRPRAYPAVREKVDIMDRTVARLNIEHYRKLLATETDETKRRTLVKLLAEEEAKLKGLISPPPERNRIG